MPVKLRRSLVKLNLGIFTIISFFFLSCENDKEPQEWKSYKQLEECQLDSITVNRYLHSLAADSRLKDPLLSFYQKRSFVPVWIGSKGPNEYAGNFMNLLDNEKKLLPVRSDSLLNVLHNMHQEVLTYSGELCHRDSLALKFEILLTMNFFDYATRNWSGADDQILKQVNWFIKRKKLNYDQLLSNYLKTENPKFISEPVYTQYSKLKNVLEKYYEIELLGGWSPLPAGKYKIVKGDTSSMIPLIRHQLYLLGDLKEDNKERLFDGDFELGLKKFQNRHGLDEDGVVGGNTLRALSSSIQQRIEKILINMERCRWVPLEIKGDYIMVNIPEFKMHVYTNNKPDWSCNVIVGKANQINNSIIFNDSIEHIVFNPYWNIPKNILMMETLPSIKKDRRYLQKNNLEIVDRNGNPVSTFMMNWDKYNDHFPYIIRERPGKNNSLGSVKFLFPNPYDIYFHDTPAKALFKETSRAFSHGCIRLQEPLKLAEHLLKDKEGWDTTRINKTIAAGKESYVKLKKKMPVFITYFTAWVDEQGQINFREDVYQHDKKMRELLIVN